MACTLGIPTKSAFKCGEDEPENGAIVIPAGEIVIPAGARFEGDTLVWRYPNGIKGHLVFRDVCGIPDQMRNALENGPVKIIIK